MKMEIVYIKLNSNHARIPTKNVVENIIPDKYILKSEKNKIKLEF